MGRKFFCLIFSKDPPAADVVRQDFIQGDLKVRAEVHFQWQKSKTEHEIIAGQILDIGTQVRLSSVKVTSSGLIKKGGEEEPEQEDQELEAGEVLLVGNRKQELEKLRFKQAHSKDNHLQGLAEQIQSQGPESFCKTPVCRRPKKRSTEQLEQVKFKLQNMPSLIPTYNKVELIKNTGLRINTAKLAILRQRYQLTPVKLFNKILKTVMGDVLHCDGISSTGRGGTTVKVPDDIVGNVLLYVKGIYTAAGGKVEDITFDPITQIRRLISNAKAKVKKQGTPNLVHPFLHPHPQPHPESNAPPINHTPIDINRPGPMDPNYQTQSNSIFTDNQHHSEHSYHALSNAQFYRDLLDGNGENGIVE
ncbi:ATP-dependent Clp protease ATP-binding subunit ClpX, partial [Frankliniella fusca]